MKRLSLALAAVVTVVAMAAGARAELADTLPVQRIAEAADGICRDIERSDWRPSPELTDALVGRVNALFADLPGAGPDPAGAAEELVILMARGDGSYSECVRQAEAYTASLVALHAFPDEPLAETAARLLAEISRTRSLSLPRPAPRASRLFATSSQYPPADFAAYAIVAFQQRATRFDVDRHRLICEAFVAALPEPGELERSLGTPLSNQVVTVWPVTDETLADALNSRRRDLCTDAVDGYDLVAARAALSDAELVGVGFGGRGPYLIAWSPAGSKGSPDAVVLQADLSHVETFEQASAVFRDWVRDIEADPALWSNGWDVAEVRVTIRNWVDRYGDEVLKLFGVK